MNWTPIYQDTFIPELPKKMNSNFSSTERYINSFYDGSLGILSKPLITTGKVKGSNGEFVTVVVDNLVVKNQFTNLFENSTTADYTWYTTFIGPDASLRDSSTWEIPWAKYIDVNKAYYKVNNNSIIAPRCPQVSQIVEFLLDPSALTPGDNYSFLMNPFTEETLEITTADSSTSWLSLMCIAYDPSYGSTWTKYHHSLGNTGGTGGGGVTPVSGILNWNAGTSKYEPYSVSQAYSSFYSSTSGLPNSTYYSDRLFLNTGFGAPNITTRQISVQGYNGNTGVGSFTSVTTPSSDVIAEILSINRISSSTTYNFTGDIIYIVDNPNTSGTVSGSLLKYKANLTTRLDFNPRVADSIGSIAYMFDTHVNLTGANARLIQVKNNGTEVSYISPLGKYTFKAGSSSVYAVAGGVLKDFYTDSSISGASPTAIYSYSIPADVLSKNGDKIIASYTFLGFSVISMNIQPYFDGQVIGGLAGPNLGSNSCKLFIEIIRTGVNTARITSQITLNSSNLTYTNEYDLLSLNFNKDNILLINGSTGSGSITGKMGYIEYKPAAIN